MPSDFSLRQVLACLNISVFDPLVEPALKKACQIDSEQKTAKREPFHNVVSLIVMQVAALICFAGLRPYAVPAGVLLVLFGGVGAAKTGSAASRFFFKVYLLAGLFLLAETVFRFFPFAVPGIVLFFLLRGAFCPTGRETRALLAFWFFISVAAAFGADRPPSLFLLTGFFSFAGVAGLLFPLKNLYWREPSVVFAVLPLFLVLGYETAVLTGSAAPVVQSGLVSAVTFAAEAFMLIFCLRRDLETGEIVLSCLVALGVFLCALLLSGGLAGSAVLFLTAFFTDARVMGRIAAVVFSCFLIIFFLSLPISLSAAGLAAALSGVVFGLFYLHLKRFALPEKI
ncbi:MAG: hypothetical protein ACI4TE_01395 [Alphaproteobacteria bacterium]